MWSFEQSLLISGNNLELPASRCLRGPIKNHFLMDCELQVSMCFLIKFTQDGINPRWWPWETLACHWLTLCQMFCVLRDVKKGLDYSFRLTDRHSSLSMSWVRRVRSDRQEIILRTFLRRVHKTIKPNLALKGSFNETLQGALRSLLSYS